MESNIKEKFPKQWNNKMGISEEEFAYIKDNLLMAYKVNILVKKEDLLKKDEKSTPDIYNDIYANTVNLIKQKRNILKDVTPEKVLHAYTHLSMLELEKNNVNSPLVEIGMCILSGKKATDEIAAKVGNMILTYEPDAVQKKLDKLRQENRAYREGENKRILRETNERIFQNMSEKFGGCPEKPRLSEWSKFIKKQNKEPDCK